VQSAEQLYSYVLIVSLLLNGVAIAGSAPLRTLLAPLRDRRLLLAALLVDVVVLPASVIGAAVLLGVDESTRVGLIIIMAASTGPIGMALVRILRAELPVAVSIIVLFSASNLVTVPAIMWLLVPEALHVPLEAVVRTLLLLVILPLAAGWSVRVLSLRLHVTPERFARLIAVVGSLSTVALGTALTIAGLIDPTGLGEFLTSRAALTVPVALVATYLAVRPISRNARRRVALWVALNARAAGLSLTIIALHLADVPEARAAALGYAGLTQVLPLFIARVTQRRWLPGVDIAEDDAPVAV
jgi:bile acid:Na+ symporter, BASS family